jgi:hypothetical protein
MPSLKADVCSVKLGSVNGLLALPLAPIAFVFRSRFVDGGRWLRLSTRETRPRLTTLDLQAKQDFLERDAATHDPFRAIAELV